VPPHFSMTFPAKLITTQLTWNDLIISDELREQVTELLDWVKYNDQLMQNWGMHKRLAKGYRALFYGPPGTGKTFTAGLIANEMKKHLYKIDLSTVVSKYIGETEKNLELLFARAEDKGWILFFDEADALFGKRTNVRDAHDKYANQEVSYLLQRIEDFNGLIILATNMKNNMDDAFIRRFNCIMKFPLPSPEERCRIWRNAFPEERVFCRKPGLVFGHGGLSVEGGDNADIPELVKKYELSGGTIMNVVHYAGLKAVERWNLQTDKERLMFANGNGTNSKPKLPIYLTDVLDGIRREFIKEGKPFIS
jgi:SpoVK/Ycf46/Vps4 family AAA+-type ATPase